MEDLLQLSYSVSQAEKMETKYQEKRDRQVVSKRLCETRRI